MQSEEIDKVIEQSLEEADQRGIRGKAVTPFLLANIVEQDVGGRSPRDQCRTWSSTTPRVGGAIAVAYAAHRQQTCP